MKGFFNIEDFKNSSNTNNDRRIVNRQRVIPQRVLDAIAQYKERKKK